jgi:hypothetical protein
MPDLDFAGRYDAGDLHKSRCEGTGCPLGATDEPLAVEPVQAKERWCDQDLFASLIDQLGSPGFPSGAFRPPNAHSPRADVVRERCCKPIS